MSPAELGQWYYLIYLVPGGAATVTLMFSAMGGARHHRAARVHAGGQGTHAAVHHAGGGHRVGGHSPQAHHAQHGPHGARHGGKTASVQARAGIGDHLMSFFGFGRVPSPFVWSSLFLGWGIVGFWVTQALQDMWHAPAAFVLPAMASAAVGSILTARLASSVIGRVLPTEEPRAITNVDLVGLTGKVAFPVDESRGRILVYDQYGTMHDCSARVASGQPAIARGGSVLVVDYDSQQDHLIVEDGGLRQLP